jgi:hypothetical protein
MFRRIVCLVCFCLLPLGAIADELTTAKRSDIRKLIDVTGGSQIAERFAAAMTQRMFSALKAEQPDVPDRAFAVMQRELSALFSERVDAPGGLIDDVVPIYSKYFSHAEIRELLVFYQSDVGQKAIAVLPQVINESMLAGQRWGESMGPEIRRRVDEALKKEGLLPDRQ